MSEELRSESGASVPDPVALGMALSRASSSVDDALTGYLDDQRHHLHEQLKQLHLDIWEKFLGVFLRLATAVVGVAAASAVAWLIWDASRSNGLLIEPFSVPPDLAARGLTGEVMASKLLDRLTFMEHNTNSGRPAKSYANSWGEHGIKLEIPETGISLSELDAWLREKLGHDTRVSGEVVHVDDALAITARAPDGSQTVTGREKDVDALIGQLAEQVYRTTQPFRYGMFLVTNGRGPEALPIFEKLATTGDKEDRLWAYNRWATSISNRDGLDAAIRMYKRGLEMDPDSIGIYDNFGNALGAKGRDEAALQNHRAQLEHVLNGRQTYVPSSRIPIFKRMVEAKITAALGGYHEAAETWAGVKRTGYPGFNVFNLTGPLLADRIGEHDLVAAREALIEYDEAGGGQFSSTVLARRMEIAQEAEDWRGMMALADAAAPEIRKRPRLVLTAAVIPMTAYANGQLGRFAAAEAIIGPTAADCYPCLLVRAQIAERKKERGRADYWFARAVAEGPSLPFAEFEWGRAWLSRGQPDDAIEKFKLANKKGAHFADPLTGWGEALMAKNQSHRALEKFAEAEKYAPNWGRLHLKWGQALAYSGNKEEAAKHFARAAALDLTPSEKQELARHK